MANNIDDQIVALTAQVNDTVGVIASATAVINGFQAILDAAIASAVSAGATPEQLAAFRALSDNLNTSDDALASAIANSPKGPAAPASPSAKK